ncbi:CMRF35-like molecule 5 [Electrophorus electricus]|uniref:CMRF35-like molecule 5 n=1 Tax=Electrophorus electricus TaxID=8005 RepID=UPI0015D0691C|nr:CMRF35-like molecule 5 [Electrophorus electricus]
MWTLILVLSSLFPAGTAAVTTVTGYKGLSVQIRCPYKSGYETHLKYLCRGECYTFRTKNIPVDSKSAKDERFSLNDDTAARVFTVTITDLRSEDGGKYWCVTEQTLRDDYTEILLVVKVDTPMNVIVSHSTYTPPTPDPSTSVYTESTWSSGDPETVTQSREINEDYVNISPNFAFENNQPESVYQNFGFKNNH